VFGAGGGCGQASIIVASPNARVTINAPYKVAGPYAIHLSAQEGVIDYQAAMSITSADGVPTPVAAFLNAGYGGRILAGAVTWAVPVTGMKAIVGPLSLIMTGPTQNCSLDLPGSADPLVLAGGQCM
jgi:hypothetical protein